MMQSGAEKFRKKNEMSWEAVLFIRLMAIFHENGNTANWLPRVKKKRDDDESGY